MPSEDANIYRGKFERNESAWPTVNTAFNITQRLKVRGWFFEESQLSCFH